MCSTSCFLPATYSNTTLHLAYPQVSSARQVISPPIRRPYLTTIPHDKSLGSRRLRGWRTLHHDICRGTAMPAYFCGDSSTRYELVV